MPTRLARWVALAALVAPAVALACHPLVNNDLPMHLAIGEYVLENGIPATDPFSGGVEAADWVPHEWLAGVLFALAERLAGETGLMALTLGLAGAIAASVYALGRAVGVSGRDLAIWSIPVWIMVGPRIMLRPHLFFLALVPLLWAVILVARRRPRLWWVVPALLAVWGNLHGSFPLGLAAVLLDIAIGTGRTWDLRTRGVRAAVVVLTPLLHLHLYSQPSFLAGVEHAVALTGDPVFSTEIREWISPIADPTFQRSLGFILAIPWTLPVVYGAILRRRELPLSFILFAVGTVVLYLDAQRFLGLYALVTLALVPALPLPDRGWKAPAIAPSLSAILCAVLLGWGLPVGWSSDPSSGQPSTFLPPRESGWGWYSGTQRLPLAEVDRLVELERTGVVICEYQYGGVIAWRSGGRLEPTLDSRNSVYGAKAYRELAAMLEVDRVPVEKVSLLRPEDRDLFVRARERLERHLEGATAVLIADPRIDPRRAPFILRLELDPKWRREPIDDPDLGVGPVLFVREVE